MVTNATVNVTETVSGKPTAGQWKWEWDASNSIAIYADLGKRENPQVASIIFDGPTREIDDEVRANMEADADLIVTAPALLAALKSADTALRHHPRGDSRSHEDIAAAAAAIARAEGR